MQSRAAIQRTFLLPVLAIGISSSTTFADPPDRGGNVWALVFEDEFDGADLDTTKWGHNYPWGQTHNHSAWVAPENVLLSNGVLRIKAEAPRHPSAPSGVEQGGQWYSVDYVSGAVHTQGRFSFTHGYMEGRFRMPAAAGTWPAFWTLNSAGGWPPEIDVLEVPHERNRFYYNYHYGADWQDHHSVGGDHWGPDLSAGFHVFGCEWDANYIAFFLDGVEVRRFWNGTELAQAKDMYLILNLAVGGWAEDPPSNSPFPTYYEADWVRVYKYRTGAVQTWKGDGDGEWDDGANWSGGSHPFIASDTARFLALPSAKNVRVNWSGLVALGHLEFDSATSFTIGGSDDKLLLARTSPAPATLVGAGAGRQVFRTQVELHNTLEIDWGATLPLSFQGALSGAGGLLLKYGTIILSGRAGHGGETRVEGGELRHDGPSGLAGGVIVTAGALAGRGTIDGNVTVKPGASLRPGSPSGVLTGKAITLESGAEIKIELRGTTRGASHGALVCQTIRVTGAILEVSLASAFRPAAEERFDIIDGTLVGRFAQVKLPALAPDLAWDLSLLYTSGTLVVKEVPRERFRRGDSTADGRLDISDSIQALGHLFLGGAPPAPTLPTPTTTRSSTSRTSSTS